MANPVQAVDAGRAWLSGLAAGPRAALRRHLPLRWRRRLAVFVGGMVGGLGRLGLSAFLAGDGGVPWATLVANLSGALLLGYLVTRLLHAAPATSVSIPLLCTGMLGSYTTFSTFSLETWQLLDHGRALLATGYALGSVFVGLLAAAVGIRVARVRR